MAPALLSLSSPHPASLASISPTELSTLSRLAADAKARAYCPYSKFRVGAAVLVGPPPKKSESASDTAAAAAATADDGVAANNTVIIGANVENAAYPVGVCAERTALSHAVVEGHRGSFRAIAVSTDISPPASPCGMCRQFIREFCPLDTPIIMFDKDQNYAVRTIGELLPMSFGPDDLSPQLS